MLTGRTFRSFRLYIVRVRALCILNPSINARYLHLTSTKSFISATTFLTSSIPTISFALIVNAGTTSTLRTSTTTLPSSGGVSNRRPSPSFHSGVHPFRGQGPSPAGLVLSIPPKQGPQGLLRRLGLAHGSPVPTRREQCAAHQVI